MFSAACDLCRGGGKESYVIYSCRVDILFLMLWMSKYEKAHKIITNFFGKMRI